MANHATEKVLLLICAFIIQFQNANSIHCYQCSGTDSINSFECNEFLESDATLQSIDCGTLHDAQYCIKHVGRNEDDIELLTNILISLVNIFIMHWVSEFHSTANTLRLWWLINISLGDYHGGITTTRYCSSLDLGNYCNYVQQPGDKLEYRTCIYTCGSDGCNSATALRISMVVLAISVGSILALI